jgi:glycosyltransferase involved in cell wall biosynthesis
MKVLFLAPHPFYQGRGTPIAVSQVLAVLSQRGVQVDVVTYHEGEDVEYEHVTLHRIPALPFVRNIRPGFSWQKIICDGLMMLVILRLLLQQRRYTLVHAVEESVFIALALKLLLRIPYVYDMDSSLVQQVVDKYPQLNRLHSLLSLFEKVAVRHAQAVIPVCQALYESIAPYHPKKVTVLHDMSLLGDDQVAPDEDLRSCTQPGRMIALYVGNLEKYQGVDLLLEGYALAVKQNVPMDLIIIGGQEKTIQPYRQKSEALGIARQVHFWGPRPIEYLNGYLEQADLLISPRIEGNNTPMKIYSYLDSGKAVLATKLPTHTQVLTEDVAQLVEPTPEALASGLLHLAAHPELRHQLGKAGKRLIKEQYSPEVFEEKLNHLYDWLQTEMEGLHPKSGAASYSAD